MEARFAELNKVLVKSGKKPPYTGYVIKTLFKGSRWIYKISISETPRTFETWDNWVPEEWLELTK
jgi:uncharacterized protein YciI